MTVYYVASDSDLANGWFYYLKGTLPVGPFKSRRLAREAQRDYKNAQATNFWCSEEP